jgi:TolB-like protein/Tfp pilus assembly protein PilF
LSSIIEGYSYDIFISYRQNDNKYDGWVTGFIDNLNTELEATIKDKISVYFDANPHDGLFETHSVDRSLEEKLKCLIFIPVISQTYCDSKSFAWQHEFCAFNKLAEEDKFGRNIKLAGGNVASRILPVKIHDLDLEDKTLLEIELGSALRSIDFIYKSAGVNRPLRANEDHPRDNLNKTYYRDQINKVANAVKEIISALKKQNLYPEKASKEDLKVKPAHQKNLKKRIIAGSVILLALIIVGLFLIPKLFKSQEQIEKSIAVLPFFNDSRDQENTYFINGIMDEILNNLQKIKDFRVISRTSVEGFRGANRPTLPEIARKLDVNYIVEGSGQKYGNSFRLRVQLIEAVTDKHLWAESYEQEIKVTNDIFDMQSQIAQAIAVELKAIITPEEKQLIEKTLTSNLTAYDFYQKGREEYNNDRISIGVANQEALKKSEILYKKALENDSTFAAAYTGLAMIYEEKHNRNIESFLSEDYQDSVLTLANRALFYDDHLAEAYLCRGYYYHENFKYELAIKEYDKTLNYNPNCWEAYYWKGFLYAYNSMDFVKAIENFQKATSINHGRELPEIFRELGWIFNFAGFQEKANYYYQEALKLDGDSVSNFSSLASVEMLLGNYDNAIRLYFKCLSTDSIDLNTLLDLGNSYQFLGQFKESFLYYKKFVNRFDNLELYGGSQMHRIGYAFLKNGDKKEADYWFDEQKRFCEESIKIGRETFRSYYNLAGVHAFVGNKEKAYENLRLLDEFQVCPLWYKNLIKDDPLFDSIRNEPAFQQIVRNVEAKYEAEHERVKKWLEKKNML